MPTSERSDPWHPPPELFDASYTSPYGCLKQLTLGPSEAVPPGLRALRCAFCCGFRSTLHNEAIPAAAPVRGTGGPGRRSGPGGGVLVEERLPVVAGERVPSLQDPLQPVQDRVP